MAQKLLGAQRDFSYGEIDVSLKRSDDHPARKAGLRQMQNMRILNSKSVQNRSGRSALFPANVSSRIEEVTMSPGNTFKLAFGFNGNGELRIFNSAGAQVVAFGNQGNSSFLPWKNSTVGSIVYAVLGMAIYITFPGMRPQIVTWDGAASWVITELTEQLVGGQKRTPFSRITKQGVSLTPSAQTGAIVLTASEAIFTAAHVGTRIRYINRQVLITNVPGPYPSLTCGALVQESLPGHQNLAFSIDPSSTYSIGDVLRGSASGSVGQVYGINPGINQITVQLLNTSSSASTTVDKTDIVTGAIAFTTSDTVVGQGGGLVPTQASLIDVPGATTYWDEEVMNDMRGYPASCFVDQFRVGFCNFPSVPGGIAWSALNAPRDLYVGTSPTSAMFEIAPDKVQVFYVVPGPESSEFVFCDRKLYYIKIDANTPLKPGSVSFQTLSGDGCARVQPRATQEVLLYANAGKNSVMAIVASGAYYRPFNTKNLTEMHGHLFTEIAAIAVPNADGSFNERYAYVLNTDGTMAVGTYSLQGGQIADAVGWGPWSGAGVVKWIAAWSADVLFTTTYFATQTICEIVDDTRYLDALLPVNSVPAPFAPPAGMGPLWWARSQSVVLMDQVTRSMGTYQVDANGFIVPQNNGGENLAAASLVAGQSWSSVVEPFCPDATPGQDMQQRMRKRRIARIAAYVVHSTGFLFARLFAGPVTPTSPALGTVMNYRRVTAWNQDDDPTLPAPMRETAERWRPLGRAYDPRVAIIKDTPGPLQILEIAIEATI